MENPNLQNVAQALQTNGFEVFVVEDKKDALEKAKELLPTEGTVGIGGSESIKEIGLLDYVVEQEGLFCWNQYERGISKEENIHRRRQSLLSDIFLASTNALTVDGQLVNIDGTGNRVAGMIFGPKKVLLIVGKNKIVQDVDAGLQRIEEVAAPLNVERLHRVAESYGKVSKKTVASISNYVGIIRTCEPKGEITIILVNEALGY